MKIKITNEMNIVRYECDTGMFVNRNYINPIHMLFTYFYFPVKTAAN